MSILIVGLSHHTATVDLLEQATLTADAASKLARRVLDLESVRESAVLATCNRLEVYVSTDRFHGTVETISQMLADETGLLLDDLLPHLAVHYDEAAVVHAFAVAAGLDSMILGESQILGQVRATLQQAQRDDSIGSDLNVLFQQAIRVGKRGRTETGIDRLAPSIVTAALDATDSVLTEGDRRFLIAGAGTMSVLAVRTLLDRGVAPDRIWLANRTFGRAVDLVEEHGVAAVRWGSVDLELQNCDVLITCTGATDVIFDEVRLRAALDAPAREGRPLTILDLALPRDVAPAARHITGVEVIDLEVLATSQRMGAEDADVERVRDIVDGEVRAFLTAKKQAKVTPTVVALRGMATSVVSAEADRLDARLPELDEATRAEVRRALHRVAEKLIHAPTVRVKELAAGNQPLDYADALAQLFALDPSVVEAVRGGDRS